MSDVDLLGLCGVVQCLNSETPWVRSTESFRTALSLDRYNVHITRLQRVANSALGR
jgi:hypothetical protein